jgi:hypothetical protein
VFWAQKPARPQQADDENDYKARDQAHRGIGRDARAVRTCNGNTRNFRHVRFESVGLGLVRHTSSANWLQDFLQLRRATALRASSDGQIDDSSPL